ncbi:MAG: acetamidase [Deltaproteobacteria bacterium]|nr:acetamidase [Deltaproteobacteria bacterium]
MTQTPPQVHPIGSAIAVDATLSSTPDTVLWGYIAANLAPALTIQSGQTVEIETLSHQGLVAAKDPEKFFGDYGIAANEVLADAKALYAGMKRPKGASVHVLTGPIYVEGAEPGDALEVRVRDIKFRVPYGVNNTGPGKGVLPKLLAAPSQKLIRLDLERRVALFSDDVQIPLSPFMGIMAVSPPTSLGMVSSTPPGAWGGNIDLKYTGIGSSLFLPVFNRGGQFFTGDGHAVQGDGEVDGGAIEISLKPTLQFVLHKKKHLKQPRVETATDYLTTGLDVDLNVATRVALQEAVDFLQAEKGLTAADAYALCSLAVDLGIGEAVDVVNLVYAKIPKHLFKNNPPFWLD